MAQNESHFDTVEAEGLPSANAMLVIPKAPPLRGWDPAWTLWSTMCGRCWQTCRDCRYFGPSTPPAGKTRVPAIPH